MMKKSFKGRNKNLKSGSASRRKQNGLEKRRLTTTRKLIFSESKKSRTRKLRKKQLKSKLKHRDLRKKKKRRREFLMRKML